MHKSISRDGALVFVVGPSGAGKDTLLREARARLSADERYRFVRRAITRAPGVDEDSDSFTDESFAAAASRGAFALSWEAHGLSYGIPAIIDTWLAEGRVVIANGSRAALNVALDKYPELKIVNIVVPRDVLAARLRSRSRESYGAITARLARSEAVVMKGFETIDIDNSGAPEAAASKLVAQLFSFATGGEASFISEDKEG